MTVQPSKKIIRWIVRGLLFIFVLYLVFEFLILPIGFAFAATHLPRTQVSSPPEGYTAVTLTTADQEMLAAWYHPSQNGAVILLIAGAGGTRENTRAYADFLTAGGFGVLAFDLRGHGESTGQANQLGWQGTRDVGAAVEFLSQQADVEVMGGLGLSLGGEVLLGAASTFPALKAVVSDGATFRSLAEHDFLTTERSLPVTVQMGLMDFMVQIFTGDQPPPLLSDAISTAVSTQFLFIAAGNETNEIVYNQAFANLVGERGTVWIVPDVGHTAAFNRYPDEYAQRITGFFTQTLLSRVKTAGA